MTEKLFFLHCARGLFPFPFISHSTFCMLVKYHDNTLALVMKSVWFLILEKQCLVCSHGHTLYYM